VLSLINIKDAYWQHCFSGPSFLEFLDNMPMVKRKLDAPLMMPISEKYKDMGTIIVGKVESGLLKKGDTLILMPNKVIVDVAAIYNEMEDEVTQALCGDNVRIRLRGIDDEDISPGFVLSSPAKPVHAIRHFEAQLAILEHKSIICAGYSAVMHVHTLAEEVTLSVCLSLPSLSVISPMFSLSVGTPALFRQSHGPQIQETSPIRKER
jgi:peptide chain release factor subunit 3